MEEFAKLSLQPIKDIHLTTEYDFDMANTVDGKYVKIFLIIGIFLIVVACINFMNLSTARASRRAKEIGLRKVVGARRINLMIQFFGESIIYTAMASFIAFFIGKPSDIFILLVGLNRL